MQLHDLVKQGDSCVEELQTLLASQDAQKRIDDLHPQTGQAALHVASFYGHAAVVHTLIVHGANPNVRARDHTTALHVAARYGYEGTVNVLLDGGATIDVVTRNKRTALHHAARDGRVAVTELLVHRGANVQAEDLDGTTPLHDAARCGHDLVVSFLLRCKAEITARDKAGRTPLELAALNGHVCVLEAISEGVSLAKDDMAAALCCACRQAQENAVRFLLSRVSDVNTLGRDSATPIHAACQGGSERVVHLLVSHGACIARPNAEGATSLHLAAAAGSEGVVRLLLSQGADREVQDAHGKRAWDVALTSNVKRLLRVPVMENEGDSQQSRRTQVLIEEWKRCQSENVDALRHVSEARDEVCAVVTKQVEYESTIRQLEKECSLLRHDLVMASDQLEQALHQLDTTRKGLLETLGRGRELRAAIARRCQLRGRIARIRLEREELHARLVNCCLDNKDPESDGELREEKTRLDQMLTRTCRERSMVTHRVQDEVLSLVADLERLLLERSG